MNRARREVERRRTALSQKDYDGVVKELQNYHTIQDDSLKNLTQDWTLNQIQPTIPSTADYPLPQPLTPPKTIDWGEFIRTSIHNNPEQEKVFLMGLLNVLSPVAPDAYEFAKISANGFEENEDYIQKNGFIVNSISDLPFETIKSKVQSKVQKQLGVNDSKGFILMPHSRLSLEIKNNKQFKNFILQNLFKFLKGEHCEGSLTFNLLSPNLYGALRRVEILDTYINDRSDIVSFVFDTYDFNPKDPNFLVECAHNVQEHGLFMNYYTINTIVIHKNEWLDWFIDSASYKQ